MQNSITTYVQKHTLTYSNTPSAANHEIDSNFAAIPKLQGFLEYTAESLGNSLHTCNQCQEMPRNLFSLEQVEAEFHGLVRQCSSKSSWVTVFEAVWNILKYFEIMIQILQDGQYFTVSLWGGIHHFCVRACIWWLSCFVPFAGNALGPRIRIAEAAIAPLGTVGRRRPLGHGPLGSHGPFGRRSKARTLWRHWGPGALSLIGWPADFQVANSGQVMLGQVI